VEETKGNGEGDGIKQRADMGRSGAAPVHDVGWERQPQGMGATCCCQIGKNAGKMPALPRKSGKGVKPFPLGGGGLFFRPGGNRFAQASRG
jgi:hypothetical protein